MPKTRLVLHFGVLSAILLGLLGALLTSRLSSILYNRNIQASQRTAIMATEFGSNLASRLRELNDGQLPQDLTRLLDAVAGSAMQTSSVVAGAVYVRPNLVAYATDRARIGQRAQLSPLLQAAFAGRVGHRLVRTATPGTPDAALAPVLRQYGSLLEFDVPARPGNDGKVYVVSQMYMPWTPIQKAIDRDRQAILLLLLAGLAILWLSLFKLFGSASKRLRGQLALNRHLANSDPLTGLPNRSLLRSRTEQALAAAKEQHSTAALLVLDLDRFKEINDTLGHSEGDKVLVQVGGRLAKAFPAPAMVARLGGDEFAVLLPDLESLTAVTDAARRLMAELTEPLLVDGVALDVAPSVGVAIFPDHGEDFETLLQRADVAMYVGKAAHAGVTVYAKDLDTHSPQRLALLGELRRAIADPNQLVLYYQPKWRIDTGEIVGFEALARWQHPQHGLIPPSEFIPAAERTGLIRELTLAVLDRALRDVRVWQRTHSQLRVAVNVSTRCLLDTHFPEVVTDLVEHYRLEPHTLELEITESAVMADPEHALRVLSRLANAGIGLSVDDFGTGYSSMLYLKRLPVHELKIDRTFVTDLTTGDSDAAIVQASIELAHHLGLVVVAEGVETEQALRRLQELRCDVAQGYLLSPPMPSDQVLDWLEGHRADAARPSVTEASSPAVADGGATCPTVRPTLPPPRRPQELPVQAARPG